MDTPKSDSESSEALCVNPFEDVSPRGRVETTGSVRSKIEIRWKRRSERFGLTPEAGLTMVSVHGGRVRKNVPGSEYDKGIRWMPWHQEAMKDVARCEKSWGAASRL